MTKFTRYQHDFFFLLRTLALDEKNVFCNTYIHLKLEVETQRPLITPQTMMGSDILTSNVLFRSS